MSWKVAKRVRETSAAERGSHAVLVAIADAAHEDNVLADPRVTVDHIAHSAGVSARTAKRAFVTLTQLDELVYFRATGAGRVGLFGVLCGLDPAERDTVYERVWTRAAVQGGRYEVLDAGTHRTDPKGCRGVTLFSGQKGDTMSRKGAVVSPFFSYVGFFPVSRYSKKERAGEETADAPVTPTTEASLSHGQLDLFHRFVGLGVYEAPAQDLVMSEDLDWLTQVADAGQVLRSRGNSPYLGADLVRMARRQQPLPIVRAAPPRLVHRPAPDPEPAPRTIDREAIRALIAESYPGWTPSDGTPPARRPADERARLDAQADTAIAQLGPAERQQLDRDAERELRRQYAEADLPAPDLREPAVRNALDRIRREIYTAQTA